MSGNFFGGQFFGGGFFGASSDEITRSQVGGPPKVQFGYWIPSKYYDFSNPFGPYKSGDEQRAELAAAIRADSVKRGLIPDDTQVEAQAALVQAALMEEAERKERQDSERQREAQARKDEAREAYLAAYRTAYKMEYNAEVERQLNLLWSMELRQKKLELYGREALTLILAAAS